MEPTRMPKTPVKSENARWPATVALMLSLLFLAACAGSQPASVHPVVDRAQQRWDALTVGDLETAYSFYSPGYRSATSLIDFGVSIRTQRVRWTSAEYIQHDCEESRCSVRFNIGFRVTNPAPGMPVYDGTQMLEDTWIKTGGQWWYLPNI